MESSDRTSPGPALFPPRLQRQLDLTFGIMDRLEPDLRPGVDLADRLRAAIQKIRGAGSRDRRFYRELIFTWFRYREWVDPLRSGDPVKAGQVLLFLAHFTRETATAKSALPAVLNQAINRQPAELAAALNRHDPGHVYSVEDLIPEWLPAEFPSSGTGLLPHTMERPPLWLVTRPETCADIVDELKAEGLHPEGDPRIPGAVALPTDSRVEETKAYREGRIEIQDIGSQTVLHHIAPVKGAHWLDACAGAGGKSLLLAGMIGPTGQVTAVDRRWTALKELRKRARRSGLTNIECLDEKLENMRDRTVDGVLVDAPCSGTGTWRRHPFLRHQTTRETITNYATRQLKILNDTASMVRPGGRLAYVTCSLCRTENESVVEAFLAANPEFAPDQAPSPVNLPEADGIGHHIFPEPFNGDGFYVAVLDRKASS